MKHKYSVSLVYTKSINSKIKLSLVTNILYANSESEALGETINTCTKDIEGFVLRLKDVTKIKKIG